MKGPPPLRIDLAKSRLAVAFVTASSLASALLFALIPGPISLRAAAVIAIGACAIRTLRDWALRSTPTSIVGIELSGDGEAVLVERSAARHEGRVQSVSYVGTHLVTLVVRVEGGRWSRAIAILPDMISAEEMRRVRVLLRVAGSVRLPERRRTAHPP